MGINFHLKRDCLNDTHKISAKQKLPGMIMKYENWEILDLAEHDFEEMK